MIDIRQMRYFVTLAETLHFGRAAERLHLTQPPLSRQIAALEKELGVKLIDRTSRHSTLTRAGQGFLEDSRAVLAAFDQACTNAKRADRGETGTLAIGFMMHAAYTVLPSLTRRFLAAYPDVDVKLREVVPNALVEDVLAARYDAGIMFSPGPVRGLEIRPIFHEKLCLAVHKDHPLAQRKIASAQDLEGQPLIVTSAEATTTARKAVEDYCRGGGFVPTIRLEAQLQNTIVNLVAENLGVALVPDSMRKLSFPGVSFLTLKNAPAIEHVLVWRPSNLNPALRNLIAMTPAKG